MSGCIGCNDQMSYEVQSDGTVIMEILRDGIATRKLTTLKSLGVKSAAEQNKLRDALIPHFKRLVSERDRSDRA